MVGSRGCNFRGCVDIGVSIGKVNYMHCFRSANQVVHVLANFSFCNKTSRSLFDEPPICVVNSLVDDVSVFSS